MVAAILHHVQTVHYHERFKTRASSTRNDDLLPWEITRSNLLGNGTRKQHLLPQKANEIRVCCPRAFGGGLKA